MTDPHREHYRRTNRVLGQFLATEAWLRGVDCLVLTRHGLVSYLGLERLKSARVDWLREDLKPWFPYQEVFYALRSDSSLYDIFLSRIPIEDHIPSNARTTTDSVAKMKSHAPVTQIFSFEKRLSTEAQIVAYLTQLSAGVAAPKRRKRGRQKLDRRVLLPAARMPAKRVR